MWQPFKLGVLMLLTQLPLAQVEAYELHYTEAGDTARWEQESIVIDLRPEHVEQRAAMAAGFEAWTAVSGSELSFAAATTDDSVHGLAYFAREWDRGPEVLAYTTVRMTEYGQIIDFEVKVNAQDHGWDGATAEYDLQAVISHEAGHALGLEHSAYDQATMFPTTEVGELFRRTLHTDDENGARFLDGLWREPSPVACALTDAAPSSWLVLLPLLLVRRRGLS